MKLEASPVQDTHTRVPYIQTQLASLHMELQDLKKGKEAQPDTHLEVWCIKFKVEGHYKDQCPVYPNYLASRGPNPLKLEPNAEPSTRSNLWCSIF